MGAHQSFSKAGCLYDNAVVEPFFAGLKKGKLHRSEYEHNAHFGQAVNEYIDFYNNERPHLSLQYKTPKQIEDEYFAKRVNQ